MTFGIKILLVLACVGVLPIALMGALSDRVNRAELQQTVGGMQTQAAQDLALFGERFVSSAIDNLRLAVSYLPFDQLSRSEMGAVLAIPYRQLRFVNVLAVIDDQRQPVAGPVFERHPERDPGLQGHEAVRDEDLLLFARSIPGAAPRGAAVAVGRPYPSRPGSYRIAVSVRMSSSPPRMLVAELSLAGIQKRLRELSRSELAYIVDDAGEPIGGGSELALSQEERELVRYGLRSAAPLVRTVRRGDGRLWLAGFAPVGQLGWGAVVAQPASVAFRAADRVRLATLYSAAVVLCITVLLSAVLARRVTTPIRRLSQAVSAVALGAYHPPVGSEGGDELAELSRAFDRMAWELKRREEEIRGWNAQLQKRVEERTAELKEAQDQIIRTRRLAALGSLGAGLAHELNNPMTAIMGYIAMLRRQLGDGKPQSEMLALAFEQAQRVVRIVEDLRRFADQERSGQGRRFSLVSTVQAALQLYDDRLRASQILVSTRFDDALPEVQGDPVQIQQVVAHLVENAITAMSRGGALDVSVSSVDGEAIKLRVADTGKGIPEPIRERIFDPFFTTKDHPSRVGLGLSVSHSIVEAHHGKILVESEEGAGASFTVLLPAAATAHLA